MIHRPFDLVLDDAKRRIAAWPADQTLAPNFADTPFGLDQRNKLASCLSLGVYVRHNPPDSALRFILTDTKTLFEVAVFAHDTKVIAVTEHHRAYSGWDLVYLGANHANRLVSGDTPQGLRARLLQPVALAAPRLSMPAEHAAFQREPLLFAACNKDAGLYPCMDIPQRSAQVLSVNVV
jgi:hypothetical protein